MGKPVCSATFSLPCASSLVSMSGPCRAFMGLLLAMEVKGYDISIEIRELEIPSLSDLDSGDNKPDAIVRFTTMNHEKFTSQKGGTLHADCSDDENDKKRLVFLRSRRIGRGLPGVRQ